ncbi:hypothetical protein L6452_17958 [Arctium lappa]|uniref:Uncharacterized protein n=1 Tax=Arctium lappa TaxID=4217 RepID=A0ACB9C4T6_ARCLA|nr:hypothetical protein L6452_17958 [Arctium lappa]
MGSLDEEAWKWHAKGRLVIEDSVANLRRDLITNFRILLQYPLDTTYETGQMDNPFPLPSLTSFIFRPIVADVIEHGHNLFRGSLWLKRLTLWELQRGSEGTRGGEVEASDVSSLTSWILAIRKRWATSYPSDREETEEEYALSCS